MKAPTLTIFVEDVVAVREGSRPSRKPRAVRSAFFQPEFKFTISEDCTWAPARSRAPSVTIDFGLSELGGF